MCRKIYLHTIANLFKLWIVQWQLHIAWQSFPQSLSNFSLVYLLARHLNFTLHTFLHPIIVIFFTAHAHTTATCFAIVSRLCHLILVSLKILLGTLSCSLTRHIHLTILISARWSATSFSFLTAQVSFPCNILLCIQLQCSLPFIIILVSNGSNCDTCPYHCNLFTCCTKIIRQ